MQLVWVIDVTTWAVLVPMLLATPDPEKRAHWVRIMFCFTSYNVSSARPFQSGRGLLSLTQPAGPS